MTLVNAYATVEQLRGQLSDQSSNADPDLLERALNATSRAIDDWCGRRFWADSTLQVRTYRPDDCECVRVDDISTATGLIVKTDAGDDGAFETTWTISTDFLLEPLNASANGGAYAWWDLVAVGAKRFPMGARRPSLQVTAKFGWSSIPAQVEQAAILRATSIFKRKESPYGVAGFGDFGAIRITKQDPDVVGLLTPFQRVMA